MSFRIAVGEWAHETNTFCPAPTTAEPFRQFMWLKGEQVAAVHGGNRTYVGGMLDKAAELGVTAVPALVTMAYPSGTITREAYDEILGEMLSSIRAALPIDGVCLSLHGAGVAEGVDDLEGAVLAAVRELVGPSVPIAVALDLHGNITEEMVRQADGLFGVNFYPHTDSYERGAEAMAFLNRVLRREIRPVMHLERLPMIIPTSTTDLDPAKRLNELTWAWEKQPGVLDCTVFHGFPYTDVPPVGMSVLAIADGDAALARKAAQAVAKAVWEAREQFTPQRLSPAEAIAAAGAVEGGPVVINDTADNPGGGSPGDGTHLLRAMIEADLQDACFGFVYDAEVAAQAHEAGVGATIAVRLGGKTDTLHGAPVEATAYVKALTDGRFRLTTPMWRGMQLDLGPCARLQIGGVDVIVTSQRQQTLDDEVFLLHGIDVRRYKIVGLKSSSHFRAGFNHLARAIIPADSPGATTLQVQVFPYQRIRRPIWPLDAETAYEG
ncbi:MAG: M81 family metallopeptidase [Bacillota bacterium]